MTKVTNKHIDIFEKAFFIREFEELLLKLFNQGLLNGTVHTCVGQELTPVVICNELQKNDRIFSNHRGHGHFLASGVDPTRLLAELMGKSDGISGGIGGSQHLYSERFISNGIQGGLTPAAVGHSFVNKKKNNNGISVAFIGDGTLGEGVLYESLNLAAVLDVPTLFVLENNQYAQSTSIRETFSGNIQGRVEGFGIKFFSTNIWDINEMLETVSAAVKYTRLGKPAFIEIVCYRLNPHSKGDDNRFAEEIIEYRKKDLLNDFKSANPAEYEAILANVSAELKTALSKCEVMAELESVDRFSYLYNNTTSKKEPDKQVEIVEAQRNNRLIYQGLKNILSKSDSVFIGEDIKNVSKHTEKPYGGAFKVSYDLSDLFPDKIINAPISEQAIVGFGIGAALNGYRAIVEIMFGDFLTLCVDQIIQQASKIPSMFSQHVQLPLIVRTPMGARRGYGPTHSQNIEKLFMFLPNINLVALNSFVDAEKIYTTIEQNIKNTTIVIEDKIGYTKFYPAKPINGYNFLHTTDLLPTVVLNPNFTKPNCIIVLYGGMLDEVTAILPRLIENEIFPYIICPTSLVPLNLNPLIEALTLTKNLVFIEEGTKYGGLSSEIIAYLIENGLDFKLKVRISNESIIPCAKKAEYDAVPNASKIFQIISDLEF
jgi:2-oxoisovalerate dehydrogenase E1 component